MEMTAQANKNANESLFLHSVPGKITRICEQPIRKIRTNYPAVLIGDVVWRARVLGQDHANENKSLNDALF
jgi:hypothetical protein